MKKIAFLFFIVLSVSAFGQQKEPQITVPLAITGTDSMYSWVISKTNEYMNLQIEMLSFEATDSCKFGFYYLFRDRDSNKYTPTETEDGEGVLPITLKKSTFQSLNNGSLAVFSNDTTASLVIKINSFKADGIGFKITKYSTSATDTLKLRLRK